MTIGERIAKALQAKNIQPSQFTKISGFPNSSLSGYIHNKNKPGADFFTALLMVIPDISLRWILTENGDMFITLDNVISHVEEVYTKRMERNDVIRSLEKEITELDSMLKVKCETLRILRCIEKNY